MSTPLPESPAHVELALAPRGWTTSRVTASLTLDPYQSRVSVSPITLRHPRTGRQTVLKEYAEDILGGSRFCIEATDGLVWVSRVTGPDGAIFLPVKVTGKNVIMALMPSGDPVTAE